MFVFSTYYDVAYGIILGYLLCFFISISVIAYILFIVLIQFIFSL